MEAADVTISHEEALAKLHENIAAAKARQEAEEQAKARVDAERPDPPHPDAEWKERGRRVFIRMLRFGFEHAPWHHPDTYAYAASESGRPWLEREIAFWEERMSWHEKEIIATRKRKPLEDNDTPYARRKRKEEEDDMALIDETPMSKQLVDRERAESDDGYGRARTARVDSRALERRDARVAKQGVAMRTHDLRWARRDKKSKVHAYDARWRSICGASVLTPEQEAGAVLDVGGAIKCARCEVILNEAPSRPKKELVMK